MCRLASRFGDYRANDPSSFTLAENMAFYPQFMFNLRRSQFVQASTPPVAALRMQAFLLLVILVTSGGPPSLVSFFVDPSLALKAAGAELSSRGILHDRIIYPEAYRLPREVQLPSSVGFKESRQTGEEACLHDFCN